ncbi:S24 family peptidase [Chryseobacterium sp.]|uniref:S24 family peptidase n=1 Tax=Chryseobacterium sp. TaxID=1871047 RepID=UPI002897E2EE|nr:S24 family peptidase [Chryseobacterium sp.]
MKNFSTQKERILQFIENKRISKNKFYIETGISNGVLDKKSGLSMDTVEKFYSTYPEVNPEWLLTGKGEMFKSVTDVNFKTTENKDKNESLNNTVPLYDLEATAGVFEVFNSNPQSIPIDHITIPNLPKCDGALYIRGDSMYPLLKSGDIVAYKTINDKYNIIWGEMYLVHINHNGDEYFFCKFLKKSSKEGYAELLSHNQHHQTVEFPLESIKALAMVKASIRFNTLY